MKTTFSKSSYRLFGFVKSDQYGKKYDAVLASVKTGKQVKIPFGKRDAMHYKDVTGLSLYCDYDSLDDDLRAKYRSRFDNKKKDPNYSEEYFDREYLW